MHFTYFIYNSDRPNAVFRDGNSGSTVDNPVIHVRPEILSEKGEGRFSFCEGELELRAAQQGAAADRPQRLPIDPC